MNGYNLIKKKPVLWLTMVAVLMAMNVVLSSFSIPVPGGHLYLNDIVICTAAILLDPLGAFIVGGVGAFLADFFFYPLPMFVSLFTHGFRSVAISLIARTYGKERYSMVILASIVGALIAIVGYTLGKAYVYSTWEYAIMKLPFDTVQSFLGSAVAVYLWKSKGFSNMVKKALEK